MRTIETERYSNSGNMSPMPPEIEKNIKKSAFIANMVSVAREFNLHVFWTEDDKKHQVLRMPWK